MRLIQSFLILKVSMRRANAFERNVSEKEAKQTSKLLTMRRNPNSTTRRVINFMLQYPIRKVVNFSRNVMRKRQVRSRHSSTLCRLVFFFLNRKTFPPQYSLETLLIITYKAS